ncbi:MAG: hypothetical protein Ct9H300mP26_2600 [Acidimicrobiales bacterium]|nr:MAG: hypothetical protein Ct9H300mP26_2600 [Acidimicrobiales bacterium]
MQPCGPILLRTLLPGGMKLGSLRHGPLLPWGSPDRFFVPFSIVQFNPTLINATRQPKWFRCLECSSQGDETTTSMGPNAVYLPSLTHSPPCQGVVDSSPKKTLALATVLPCRTISSTTTSRSWINQVTIDTPLRMNSPRRSGWFSPLVANSRSTKLTNISIPTINRTSDQL